MQIFAVLYLVYVQRLIAISGGAGSGLDGGAFGRILDLFPSVEDVIVGQYVPILPRTS